MPDSVPVLRPLLPDTDRLDPYLRRIDASRWYTNGGPLLESFEAKLAEHFEAGPHEVATSSNATLAIAQCLRALDVPEGSLCVMPSWTFVATAAAAVWAGLKPYFVDVDPETWVLRPEDVREVAVRHNVGAVVLVSAFGARLDVEAWKEFTATMAIPVVIDAAAGFDSFSRRSTRGTHIPTVISLHATKVFGVGEGSAVIHDDAELVKRIRAFGNFGFSGSRQSKLPGVNAKMSEYTAAIGLAQFDLWRERRQAWADLTSAFVREVAGIPELRLSPGFGDGWVSSFGVIEFRTPEMAAHLIKKLTERRVETRQWWDLGCHSQAAYRDYRRTAMPNTDSLARRVIGLPFWLGQDPGTPKAIFDMIKVFLAMSDVMSEPHSSAGTAGETTGNTDLVVRPGRESLALHRP